MRDCIKGLREKYIFTIAGEMKIEIRVQVL